MMEHGAGWASERCSRIIVGGALTFLSRNKSSMPPYYDGAGAFVQRRGLCAAPREGRYKGLCETAPTMGDEVNHQITIERRKSQGVRRGSGPPILTPALIVVRSSVRTWPTGAASAVMTGGGIHNIKTRV